MIVANYLLLALGVMGATDILLYHSVSHGIRAHQESRSELITHALRGPTYAVLFLVTPNSEMRGAWAIFFMALLLFDVGISIADFWLERASRAAFGGLPSGEYVLHMLMAMVFGAFVACAAPNLWRGAAMKTALIGRDDLAGGWARAALAIFAAGVLVSGAMDALAAARLRGRRPKLVIENL
jgi:hypothetical protein